MRQPLLFLRVVGPGTLTRSDCLISDVRALRPYVSWQRWKKFQLCSWRWNIPHARQYALPHYSRNSTAIRGIASIAHSDQVTLRRARRTCTLGYWRRFFLQQWNVEACFGKEVVPVRPYQGEGRGLRMKRNVLLFRKLVWQNGFATCPLSSVILEVSKLAAHSHTFIVNLLLPALQYLCWLNHIVPWLSSITFLDGPSCEEEDWSM